MENTYIKLANIIRERIKKGEYREGNFIPSEKNLCNEMNCGRSTVRKGLQLLVDEKYIQPIQGKGYIICIPKNEDYILYFNETNAIETGGDDVILINVKVIIPDELLENKLNLIHGKNVVMIERLIKSLNKYVAYDCKYVPYSSKTPIIERELYSASVPELFSKDKSLFGLTREMKIKVGNLMENEAKILHCEKTEPVLIFDQIIKDNENKIIGCSMTKFLGKYLKLEAILE